MTNTAPNTLGIGTESEAQARHPQTQLSDSTSLLGRMVGVVLSEAEACGVPVDDLRVQFSPQPPSYDQLRTLYSRLNHWGFWIMEDGARVLIGKGEPPAQLYFRPFDNASANHIIINQELGGITRNG